MKWDACTQWEAMEDQRCEHSLTSSVEGDWLEKIISQKSFLQWGLRGKHQNHQDIIKIVSDEWSGLGEGSILSATRSLGCYAPLLLAPAEGFLIFGDFFDIFMCMHMKMAVACMCMHGFGSNFVCKLIGPIHNFFCFLKQLDSSTPYLIFGGWDNLWWNGT